MPKSLNLLTSPWGVMTQPNRADTAAFGGSTVTFVSQVSHHHVPSCPQSCSKVKNSLLCLHCCRLRGACQQHHSLTDTIQLALISLLINLTDSRCFQQETSVKRQITVVELRTPFLCICNPQISNLMSLKGMNTCTIQSWWDAVVATWTDTARKHLALLQWAVLAWKTRTS